VRHDSEHACDKVAWQRACRDRSGIWDDSMWTKLCASMLVLIAILSPMIVALQFASTAGAAIASVVLVLPFALANAAAGQLGECFQGHGAVHLAHMQAELNMQLQGMLSTRSLAWQAAVPLVCLLLPKTIGVHTTLRLRCWLPPRVPYKLCTCCGGSKRS
jgi:ABC-type sugar transport system permease subunit